MYGNSIFLSGLAAWLQTQPGLTVRRHLPADGPFLPVEVGTVIVDLHETPAPESLTLFEQYPRLTVTVMSRQMYPLQAFDDILHCLK